MHLNLGEKRALVTGSNRGTGAQIATTLAREGATVFVHGPEAGNQEQAAALLRQDGLSAYAVTGDLSTDAGGDRLREEILAHGPGIDILVNNLGLPAQGRWFAASAEDWLQMYQTNTLSAVRAIERFVPEMRERGWGRVVQLATIGVLRPGPRMPHYYASKAALASTTVSLARELAGSGITVNTVSPGLIHTGEMEQYFRHLAQKHDWGTDWDAIERRGVERMMPNPLQRMARPEEVAHLVAYLCSDQAGYINATNVRIDGGATETIV